MPRKTIILLAIGLIFIAVPLISGATICPTEYGEPVLIGTAIGPTFFYPKAIVVHHSADGGVNADNEAWKWEGYRNYHKLTVHPGVYPEWTGIYVAQQDYPDGLSYPDQKDYNDIDYHFGVGPSGKIYAGRDPRTVGWHAGGSLPGKPEINTYALGVCLMGDFTYEPPSETQLNSAVGLVADLCIRYNIPFFEIYGHKEIRWTTACPGNAFPLAEFKERVRKEIAGFYDVKYSDWFWSSLRADVKEGILNGYPDLTFRPYNPVSRAEFIQGLCIQEGGKPAPVLFEDCKLHWARNAISWALNEGLVKGYDDGTFKPDQPITRGEVAMIISRLLKLPAFSASFPDLPSDNWAFYAIGACVKEGYFKGYPDGTFRPDNPFLRAEMAVLYARID